MKKILYSPGEPAGIGPDLIIRLCKTNFWENLRSGVGVLGDPKLFLDRAKIINKNINLIQIKSLDQLKRNNKGELQIIDGTTCSDSSSGVLNPKNAKYVIDRLNQGIDTCLLNKECILVTGPISKNNIVKTYKSFMGHTEWIQKRTKSKHALMLLSSPKIKVALSTTHIPLKSVSSYITKNSVLENLRIIHRDLQKFFKIKNPRITVLGLNPHAGENGTIGTEEGIALMPAIKQANNEGIHASFPISADTAFTKKILSKTDVYLSMYHDQALPVLKALSFGKAVNVTLGIPLIRISVDHGTALELAGKSKPNDTSLKEAFTQADTMI